MERMLFMVSLLASAEAGRSGAGQGFDVYKPKGVALYIR